MLLVILGLRLLLRWIPFPSLKIPHTTKKFHEWIVAHVPLLKSGFSWNSWMHWLPKEHQRKEISSRLHDPRVLEHFQRYHAEPAWLPLPPQMDANEKTNAHHIPLQGEPRSWKNEKNEWGLLSFPNFPDDAPNASVPFTATQVQGYVTQKLCPRWARFQRLGYQIDPHPRLYDIEQENQSRKQHGIIFKKEVLESLQNAQSVCFETAEFTWQEAIKKVVSDKKPLFLARAKFKVEGAEGSLNGSPDLIYIRHQGSHICLEVWDIKSSQSISYAQKWRVAFYAHLLDSLLKHEMFPLPVNVSPLGGLVYPSGRQEKLFEKAPFALAPYKAWMPRLIDQWKTDSERGSSIENYSMEVSCTSCRYFSYCYQETLYQNAATPENQAIVSKNIESNDFPKNSKHWYCLHYDPERILWQCWENGESIKTLCIHLRDFTNEEAFLNAAASQLHQHWIESVNRKKNPHFLVYESGDWHFFQKAFQNTVLKSLWDVHICWTSIHSVLRTHFIWPVQGRLTSIQASACLGITSCQNHTPSLYHRESFSETSLALYRQIWNWCLSHVKSNRMVSFEESKLCSIPLLHHYLAMHHREAECRTSDILAFQKNSLPDRVKQFRAIGPISFLGSAADKQCCQFSLDPHATISKFRVGDFLKLSPVGSDQIQEGFSVVLETYLPEQGILSVRPLSKKISLGRNQSYALDEDATDWNAPKITRILNLLKDPKFSPDVWQMLLGHSKSFTSGGADWIEQWYSSIAFAAGLNPLQQKALKLPFREKIGLIEGPPGTGKTHLLVWTLIALVVHAKSCNRSIKILVTAQTHAAIDQILKKVAKTLSEVNIASVSLWKHGRFDEGQFSKMGIGRIQKAGALYENSCLILGATGYGVYQLLEDKNFPQIFDWVVFDESSQVLTPYALLSLIFGKGQALFYGDTQQLAPVLKGNYANTSFVPRSILQELISRYEDKNRLRLNETYRMNTDICKFASEQWYEGELQSVVEEKNQQFELHHYPLFRDDLDGFLDPSKSITVVQLDHLGSQQSSQEEAQWIAKAVKRLTEDYSISSGQIGIISPHRLQNNTILSALKEALPFSLKLPRVDTVERMQGAEFDIVIYSATVSDKKTIHSPFLKGYRRFNVALTRARKNFLFVASSFFFQSFPSTEDELIAQMPFEKLLNY